LAFLAFVAAPGGSEEEPISDNSFFIEEAYNQEPGVVQHIFVNFNYFSPQRDMFWVFTQEWPISSQTHQFSYSVPLTSLNSGVSAGIGDLMLNYRHQWPMAEESRLAIAPRASVVVPTGDANKGLGSASWGAQFNLPVSKVLSPSFVTHWNAGLTWLPSGKGFDTLGAEVRASLISFNAGASVIWLAAPLANLMLEYVFTNTASIDASGLVARTTEHVLSPGVRFAINAGDLQVVPGIAVPFSWQGTTARTGFVFYLSLEHPF